MRTYHSSEAPRTYSTFEGLDLPLVGKHRVGRSRRVKEERAVKDGYELMGVIAE